MPSTARLTILVNRTAGMHAELISYSPLPMRSSAGLDHRFLISHRKTQSISTCILGGARKKFSGLSGNRGNLASVVATTVCRKYLLCAIVLVSAARWSIYGQYLQRGAKLSRRRFPGTAVEFFSECLSKPCSRHDARTSDRVPANPTE